jgi:hypothetical protein
MPSLTADGIAEQAAALAGEVDQQNAVARLIDLAGGDRQLMEAARDRTAALLHTRVDDWNATAALTLLNRALSRMPRHDPLDWRERWSRHRKP